MSANSRTATRAAALAVGLLVLAWTLQEWLLCRPNRIAIIAVMRDLRRGMPRHEVDQVLVRHDATRLVRASSQDALLVDGVTGLARNWQLGMAFDGGRLRTAKVWTEDGPYHPVGVPPDIGG